MQEIKERPPNYALLEQVFPIEEGNIYAWGDKIYNPSGREIPEDIKIHEAVHLKRQNGDPESWWHKYLLDPEFRLEEELQAYGTQYAHIKKLAGSAIAKEALFELADNLRRLYKLDLDHSKAESLIRRYSQDIK